MATENVATITLAEPISKHLAKKMEAVSVNKLDELGLNDFACDYETLRALWEAQCICSMIDDALDGCEIDKVKIHLAVQGVERLLAGAIKRAGFDGVGWGNRL